MLTFLLVILVFLLYTWLKWHYSYWSKNKVPFVEPKLLFGNYYDLMTMKKNNALFFDDLYQLYPDEPAVGIFRLRQPQLLIKEPELAYKVLSSEFQSFHDNDLWISEENDPMFYVNPFFTKGDVWKKSRAISTPALTPGKIKGMLQFVLETNNQMIDFINRNLGLPLEAKYLSGQFTTDVVSAAVYGLESNSFKNPDSMFRKMTHRLLNQDFFTNVAFMMSSLAPWVNSLFRLRLLPTDVSDFFISVIDKTIDYRNTNNIKRSDFLQSLIELQAKHGFPNSEVAAHTITFLADGYETSSILMSYCLYQLAIHPDIQDKLREEIRGSVKDIGNLDYDIITTLPYLDAVVKETLRLYPPLTTMTRLCTKDIKLEESGRVYPLTKGATAVIPIYSLQRDAKYYQHPTRFEPERFLEKTDPKAFLSFSLGPRACPGSRFALMQVKAAVIAILFNFQIIPKDPNKRELEMNPVSNIFISAKDGIWIKFNRIEA